MKSLLCHLSLRALRAYKMDLIKIQFVYVNTKFCLLSLNNALVVFSFLDTE